MSIRITTSMIASGYSSNLNQSRNDLSRAMRKAYTYRAFDQVSDDPFAAGQTFQVRRATDLNEDYQSNLDNVQGAVTTAESTLRDVYNIMSNADSSSTSALQAITAGLNGSMSADNRKQIATELTNMRDSILADMNQEYADEYLFSGAGTSQAPFTVDSKGNLLYRGINVDTGENTNGASASIQYNYGGSQKTMQINFGTGVGKQLDGYTIQLNVAGSSFGTSLSGHTLTVNVPTGKTKNDLENYMKSSSFQSDLASAIPGFTGSTSGVTIDNLSEVGGDAVQSSTGGGSISSFVNLSDLSNEKVYVDVGLGLKTAADGSIVDQTAYNSALPGINFLGYGTDKDGTSKNIYNILTKMANVFSNNSDAGSIKAAMAPYTTAFSNAMTNFANQQADVGSKMNFLTSTDNFLTDANTNLQTKDEQVEFVDPSSAIVSYYMQQYSYQAAIHTGNSLMQPTLLDFMK